MHHPLILALLAGSSLCVGSNLRAQSFYIPDNLANAGTCNVIPFGSTTTTSSFYTCITQQIVTAADLNSTPGLITGLGFAACGTGKSRFSSLQVVMDLAPPNTTLSPTFANNLTPNARVVLDVTNYAWHTTVDQWMEIGLQDFFVFDGVSDVVIQIIADQSLSPAGFHRSTTRPRVYATGWSGTPPLSGTVSSTTAQKMEIGMLNARLSTYGDGCQGSNALPPTLVASGTPQAGQTLQLDLSNALPSNIAFFAMGFGNGAPLPIDLGVFGAPGCMQYVTTDAMSVAVTDASGTAQKAFVLPNSAAYTGVRLYGQWVCLDLAANALGATTSDYARILIGL